MSPAARRCLTAREAASIASRVEDEQPWPEEPPTVARPPQPPVGTVLETRDGDDVYRIERLPKGWAIQYRTGEGEGSTHTMGRISWRAAWSAWGPPTSGSPLVPVPTDAPPLPSIPEEAPLDLDYLDYPGASGGRIDMPPAAEPYRPRKRTTSTPTPARRPAAPTATGGTMTAASIADVRTVITQAVSRAHEALGPLQQAVTELEEARGLFLQATAGSEQADVSEAAALVGRAIGEVTDAMQAVQAATASAEAVSGRL